MHTWLIDSWLRFTVQQYIIVYRVVPVNAPGGSFVRQQNQKKTRIESISVK